MGESAKVIDATERLGVIHGGGKKLPPNNKSDRRRVDPIKEVKDIRAIEDYLDTKIKDARNSTSKKIAARNKLLFIVGTRTGFRVSDLERFTWGLIFNMKGEFHTTPESVKEIKTKKIREVILSDTIKKAFLEYIEIVDPDIIKDNYIFIGNKTLYELYNVGTDNKIIDDITMDITTEGYSLKTKHRGLTKIELEEKKKYLDRMNIRYSVRRFHIGDAGIEDMIKAATNACNIKGHYACRSLRKTYAYRAYQQALEIGMYEIDALDLVRDFLNHWNSRTTLKYLGLSHERDLKFMNDCEW